MKSPLYLIAALAYLAGPASAVCHNISYTTCEDGITHHYDTETGEICDARPCGGGRAPLRTDVPGCPAYKGTSTWPTSASYLSCWTGKSSQAAASTAVATMTATTATGRITAITGQATVSSSGAVAPTSAIGRSSSSSSSTDAPATTEPPRPSDSQSGGQGSPNSAGDAAKPQTSESGASAATSLQSSLLAVAGAFVAGLVALA